MLAQEITQLKVRTNFVDLFSEVRPFFFDDGSKFDEVQVAYQTYGELNKEKNNAILICHALTGNAHAAGILQEEEFDKNSSDDFVNKYSVMNKNKVGWWDDLIGPGKSFDTNKYFVICSNVIGSCYGSSGPTSTNLGNDKAYQASFPKVTVRDMVRVQKELIDYLGVKKLKSIAGGSLGGMQVLEWAVLFPDIVESIIPIATSAKHSPWAIGIGEVERQAIKNDPNWNNGFYTKQPEEGLALARKIAMLSYRTFQSYNNKFGRDTTIEKSILEEGNDFQVNSYLNYQGNKLVKRFDANAYIRLADAMDYNDLGYDRGELEKVLESIKAKTLTIGISSDLLYPLEEQKFIAKNIPNAEFTEVQSEHGHDGFLVEFKQMSNLITDFLSRVA